MGRLKAWLVENKDAAATVQSLANVVAWIAAAIWVLFLFDPLSQLEPDLGLTQSVYTSKLADNVILLLLNSNLQDTTKSSATIQCVDLKVERLLPSTDQNIQAMKSALWDSPVVPYVGLPTIKHVRYERSKDNPYLPIVVPAGSTALFTASVFIPESISQTESELTKSILITTTFYSKASCKSGGRIWQMLKVYDLSPAVSGLRK